MNAPSRPVGGPVVAYCSGPSCTSVRERRHQKPQEDNLAPLRTAISATRGGVLIRCGCLGRCHLAAVMLLVWRGPVAGEPLPLAGMDDADRLQALADWLPGPGPANALLRNGPLPAALAPAHRTALS